MMEPTPPPKTNTALASGPETAAPPQRVLLIEDEFMIAEFVAGLLTSHGFVIAGQVGTVEAALEAIETVVFDCALLDVNINGVSVAPVADRLAVLGKRYVFLTGYARHRLPPGHSAAVCVAKPIKTPELLAALGHRPASGQPASGQRIG
jgi:CheY-like chemotaxis protein